MSHLQQYGYSTQSLQKALRHKAALVESYISTCLDNRYVPERLKASMLYSLNAGGKRLRPILLLSCASLCGLPGESVLPFAVAVEMIHTYSLIHDDLPAMDNDDLRRGKPSNHKAFDEATAILAGDALLTDAFLMMCRADVSPARLVASVEHMAMSAGSSGMAGGQMLDMIFTGHSEVTPQQLIFMQELKTGALIRGACLCGAILAGADEQMIARIRRYGDSLGKAFQIVDDILDIVSDTGTLGKPVGSDVNNDKITYPSIYGLEKSRELANEYKNRAIAALESLEGDDADFLRSLSVYIINRID